MKTNGEVIEEAEALGDFLSELVKSTTINAYLLGHDAGLRDASSTPSIVTCQHCGTNVVPNLGLKGRAVCPVCNTNMKGV